MTRQWCGWQGGVLFAGILGAVIWACVPYGASTDIGQAFADAGSCSGVARCCTCTPSGACTGSCTSAASGWQAAIENGVCTGSPLVCDTVLLGAGTYYIDGLSSGGTLILPTGADASHRVAVNRSGSAQPILIGAVECGAASANVQIQGLWISGLDSGAAIKCERTTSTAAANIRFVYDTIQGGTHQGVQVCGNVTGFDLDASVLDGGADGDAVRVLCSHNSGSCADDIDGADLPGVCEHAPKVTIYENRIVRKLVYDYDTPGGRLLNMVGADDSTVSENTFGDNVNGTDCVHLGGEGVAVAGANVATLSFYRNNVTAGACPGEALLIDGQRAPSVPGVAVRLNYFLGSTTDGVTVADYASADFRANYFDGARFLAINAGDPADPDVNAHEGVLIFSRNTMRGGAFTLGADVDGTSLCPAWVSVDDNIFAQTAMFVMDADTGRECTGTTWGGALYKSLSSNVLYQTTGDELRHCVNGIFGTAAAPWVTCRTDTFCAFIGGYQCKAANVSDPNLSTADPVLTGYHIASTSSARNSGSGGYPIAEDLDADVVPQQAPDATPDRGADEYVTPTTTSTSTTSTSTSTTSTSVP